MQSRREEIARIIDPWAFGTPIDTDDKRQAAALTKADAILALLAALQAKEAGR